MCVLFLQHTAVVPLYDVNRAAFIKDTDSVLWEVGNDRAYSRPSVFAGVRFQEPPAISENPRIIDRLLQNNL